MQAEGRRFECFRDPANKWMIWDNTAGRPAAFSQITLVGLSEWEAHSMCRLLNNLDAEEKADKQGGA